jgi:hypothetical protein
MIALYPASLCSQGTSAEIGLWNDANFYGLLASAILQLLNLGLQIFGPVLFPKVFQLKLSRSTILAVWVSGGVTVVATLGGVVMFGLASARWGLMVSFIAQAMMGLVQLLLVFGA